MASNQPPDVPTPLWTAMVNAGQKYNVPPLVLAAIWRGESGSTYPNPAVNSQGYGGLFGTKLWNGTTQQQADYAASIFHNALVQTNGNILEANGIYATGKPNPGLYGHAGLPTGTVGGYGGGATSVTLPGTGLTWTSFFKLVTKNSDGTYGPGHLTQTDIKDLWNSYSSGNTSKDVLSHFTGVPASSITGPSNQFGPVGNTVGNAYNSVVGGFQSIADAFSFIFSLRGLQVIGGGIILLMGIYLLARQVGLGGFDAPKVIVQGANTIAGSNQSRATNAALTKAYHEGQADAIGDAQPKKKPARDYGEVPF